MMKHIEGEVKQFVTKDLITRVGLTEAQVDRSIGLASQATRKVINESIARTPDLTRQLVDKQGPTPGTKEVWEHVGSTYANSLTKELGLDAAKAAQVKDAVLPKMSAGIIEHANGSEEKARALLTEVR